MKKFILKPVFILIVLNFINSNRAFSQTLSINYSIGKTVKNNVIFPPLISPAQGVFINYAPRKNFNKKWQLLYPRSQLIYTLSSQSLGNAQVLGRAWGGLVGLDFYLYQRCRHSFHHSLQLGLAALTRHYDSFRNPQNVVIGSTLNAFGKVQGIYSYKISPKLSFNAAFAIIHYSNAGVQSPNLGVNIAAITGGISYHFDTKINKLEKRNLRIYKPNLNCSDTLVLSNHKMVDYQRKYRPFAQFGLGFSSIASRGAKFPVYTVFAGLSKQFSPKGCVSAGLEWVYNTATFELYNHIAGGSLNPKKVYRYSFMAQYEFIFARFALLAAGGVYLNSHIAQRSVFSSKISINYYFRSLWKQKNFHPWLGLQVRAYFGEAEFAEIATGIKF